MRFEIDSSQATCGNECVRRYPRAIFSVPLTLHHLRAGGVRTSPAISLDVSEGGIGALVQDGLSIGETVAIDMPLRERTLNAVAIVRHISKARCGFEFVGLTQEERAYITSIVGET